ncbi:hypothetical protein DES32_1514 [Methylovirgula ligni]|uniref:Uncharacterized protein n=1 Tax=Methylovirgula ligni TaxID=569860 RepID=A0A3D9Z3H0_9HYPH|nr:hypothetical protein [Methylovirgula ligni]REF87879.1 hypothetical protein DES32_1514 [Methylovirgula ligni]
MSANRQNIPPPTIAAFAANRGPRVIVYCERIECFHHAAFDVREFGLPDELPVTDILRHRRFVCSQCGNRRVSIRPEPPRAPGQWIPGERQG